MSGVIRAFRARLLEESRQIRDESGIVRIVADSMSGDPPSRYHGLMTGVEHFDHAGSGTMRESDQPIPFSLDFDDDYCSCADGTLQMRVVRVHASLAHPNRGPGGIICLGPRFRPGTRLRPLLEHLHRICSGRVFATDSPLDPRSAEFFRRYPDRVRALRSEPLWHAPIAQRIRVEARDQRGSTR